MGALLAEQKGIYLTNQKFPYINPAEGGVTFDVANLNLDAGKTYAFMLSWDRDGGAMQEQVFKNDRYGSYTNGQLWQAHDRMSYEPD